MGSHGEYGRALGAAMRLLGKRGEALNGEVDHATVSQAHEVMTTLVANMHLAQPEQRMVAGHLVGLALGDIRKMDSTRPRGPKA